MQILLSGFKACTTIRRLTVIIYASTTVTVITDCLGSSPFFYCKILLANNRISIFGLRLRYVAPIISHFQGSIISYIAINLPEEE